MPIVMQLQYEMEIQQDAQIAQEIRGDLPHTPSLPPSRSSSNIYTPTTVRTITRYGRKILDGPELHSRFNKRLNAFIKSSISTAYLAVDLQMDIAKSKAAEKAREQRRQSRRRILQSGGVLYAEEARRIVKQRDEDEVIKAEGILQRAKERELRARKKTAKRLAIDCKKHRRELIKRWKARAN